MTRHSISRRSIARSGYTLLEVLLALAVLLILATFSTGPLLTTWRDNRLGEATEQVRTSLSGTRFRAVDLDETWQFRFEPGGTKFIRVSMREPGDDEQAAVSGRDSGALPEGMQFMTESVTGGGQISNSLLKGLPDERELSVVNWGSPIVFYSDGTASAARFEVVDEYGGSRMVRVRDLTGAATVKRPGAEN